MRFEKTKLDGLAVVHVEPSVDERGSFARTFCDREFASAGLETHFVQSSTAFTKTAGTIRGLHYQRQPHWETKLVRCTRGAAFVVAVDIRDESPTKTQWLGFTLAANSAAALYVPIGFIQGYQTLEDNTELLYQMNRHYHPEVAHGYRFDDPAFNIAWPIAANNISEKDLSWGAYEG